MASINNIKIGRRLTIVFALFILFFIAAVVFSLTNMRALQRHIDEIYKVNLLSVDYLIEADRDAYQSNLALTQCMQDIIYNDKEKFENTVASVWENYDQIALRYGNFEKSFKIEEKPEYAAKNEVFHKFRIALKGETEAIIENLRNKKHEVSEKIYYSSYDSTFEAMRNIMNDFTEMSLANGEKYYLDTLQVNKTYLRNAFVINVFVIVLLIIAAVVLTRSIVNPLAQAVYVLKNVAGGNLTKNVTVKGKDEIAELLTAVSNMTSKLKSIIHGIKESAESLSAASSQISDSSQQMSQGATEQASSAEEISSSMEEMVSNIQQNTDNARQTESISGKAKDSMMEMSKIGKESFDSIKTIAEKITIINDIAFQTNLLALNAAVEAARAGEHGRGFAVVAAEVRKLAERSKLAADEIENLSKNSLIITEKTRGSLDSLVPEIQKTSQLVQEIAAASVEQNSGANQINSAIQQLNIITQQNAASSEELASSATELTAQAENLKQSISFFTVESEKELTQSVSQPNILQPVVKKKPIYESKTNQTGKTITIDTNTHDFESYK